MLIFTSYNTHKSPAITPFVEKSYLVLSFLLQRLGRMLTLSALNHVKKMSGCHLGPQFMPGVNFVIEYLLLLHGVTQHRTFCLPTILPQ